MKKAVLFFIISFIIMNLLYMMVDVIMFKQLVKWHSNIPLAIIVSSVWGFVGYEKD